MSPVNNEHKEKALKATRTSFLKMPPLKESHDKYVPGLKSSFLIPDNGARIIIAGRPGSGKSVLTQNLFRPDGPLYQKFERVYWVIPQNSFLSVKGHPAEGHDRVYHSIQALPDIMDELEEIKKKYQEYQDYKKELKAWRLRVQNRKRKRKKDGEDEEEVEDEEPPPPEVEPAELEYSCLIVDDFGPDLKDTDIDKLLRRFFSRSRHYMCQVYVVCQEYLQLSRMCRKLLNFSILFEPANPAWEVFVNEQLLQDRKQAAILRKLVFDEKYNTLLVDEEKRLYKNFEMIDLAAYGLN